MELEKHEYTKIVNVINEQDHNKHNNYYLITNIIVERTDDGDDIYEK